MLTEHAARAQILAALNPLPVESRPLLAALDAYVARDLLATIPLPGFDNSAMDGYALAFDSEAAPGGSRFRCSGAQAAGADLGLEIAAGQCARVFTGAPLPAGTTAVVMQEDVRSAADGVIELTESVARGEFIRRAGSDLCRGQRILRAGDRLHPARLSLLASQGLAEVAVHRAPRAAIFSTGDELVAPGVALAAGQLYDSNSTLLTLLARQAGATVTETGHLPDELAGTIAAFDRAAGANDVLLLSGGVSVGERDFVKPALAAVGFETALWRVAIKPGKPFLFARHPRGTVAFGLPGNPVSSFVTFLVLVAPALRRLQGAAADAALPLVRRQTAIELVNRDGRPHYLRGRLTPAGSFEPQGRQESHALAGLAAGTALARVPAATTIPAGGEVEILEFAAA